MYHFFAYMARMKLIRRWSLMRNTQPENDAEHSMQVAIIAHALALTGKETYHRDVNPQHVATVALYHDATQVLTGDLPTPIKYHSDDLRSSFGQMEALAAERLLTMLPENLRATYKALLCDHDPLVRQYVKAADKISAYAKCLQEQQAGNHEFDAAAENILSSIHSIDLPQVNDFMIRFMPSFSMTLDELNRRPL